MSDGSAMTGSRPASMWVTAAEAVEELGGTITQARIRDWARRGLLTPVWRESGRPKYVLADVFAVEAATRRSRAGNPKMRRTA